MSVNSFIHVDFPKYSSSVLPSSYLYCLINENHPSQKTNISRPLDMSYGYEGYDKLSAIVVVSNQELQKLSGLDVEKLGSTV